MAIALKNAEPAMPVPDRDFAVIVRSAPLVSIDLIIADGEGCVLLGLRNNEPAKDFFFVPGGVIWKGEKIADAFSRILTRETGLSSTIGDATFLGVYEHFYDTNRYGDPSFGTHYVVLAHRLQFERRPDIARDDQHSRMEWMSVTDLLESRSVHENTKAYFQKTKT